MTWSKRAVPAAALLLALAGPAFAQVTGHPLEISGGAGLIHFDTRARIDDAPAYTGSLGLRLSPWFSFEAAGLAAFSDSKIASASHNVGYFGGDLRWNLRPADHRAVPFVLTGVGYAVSRSSGRVPQNNDTQGASLGAGLLLNVGGPRTYVRLQVRDVIFRDRTYEAVNDFAVTAGLQFQFGGKFRDQDLDGVRDWLDRCPNTPLGARVDAAGCPSDADADSVFDGIDECENTPRGCTVDRKGCPVDADGDGVCDGIDTCPDTPKGATVDARGCPADPDSDRVWSGMDACENTPRGCEVDEKGCPRDSDGDGVCDGLDRCPGTPRGLQVDAQGCIVEAVQREMELLDTGMIRLEDVKFESGKSEIPEAFKPSLDAVGAVLVKWPTLRIEIGGHTDSQGSTKDNQKLSEARVRAVLDYLVAKFPEIDRGRFRLKGYGESTPIASNDTPEGMARNRRVEFVVQNVGVLKREIERRRAPQPAEGTPGGEVAPPKPESAPPDTSFQSAPPDTSK